MARSVTYNGITRYKPGGITKINAEALNQVLLTANSIVALIGEAEGGAPGSAGLVRLDNPSRATAQYKSGPLVDSARLAFQSSGDPNILAGASRVLLYKTNNSTQASLSLPSANADNVVGTDAVPILATGGSTTTLEDTVGLAPGTFADDELVGMWVVVRPFTATAEVRQISAYDDATSEITWVTALNSTTLATDPYLVLEDEIELSVAIASGTTLVLTPDATDWTGVASEHVGRWVYIVDTATDVYLRRITANDTTTVTITPALPAVPTAGAYMQILPNALDITSADYGLHTNGVSIDSAEGVTAGPRVMTVDFEGLSEISPELGDVNMFHVLYRGAGAAVAADTVDTSPTPTATSISLVTGTLTPSDHVGQQVLVGTEFTTITANTATLLTLSPPLSSAPAAGTAVVITTLTKGLMEVSGAAGVATGLSVTLSGVVGDDLALTFAAGQTLRQLQDTINTNPNYVATIPAGINPDTRLAADFDFGPDSEVSVLNAHGLDKTVGLRQDVKTIADYLTDIAQYVNAVRSSDAGSSVAGCCRPAAWDPAVVQGADDPFNLVGGTRGVSTNSDFQAGFDALLKVRVNGVSALVDEDLVNEGFGSTATVASVAAQLADHLATCRGTAQNTAGERGGFQGFQGTKSEIIAQANAINDFDVQLTAQHPTVLNAFGTLQEFGPRMLAVMGMSMRAGAPEVGEPLTFKYLRVSGLTNDNSWDPADVTDANDFIKAGILFAETIEGKGTRWVRDITTHVQDDNLAYVEGSVRDSVRFIAFGLREFLVDRFTGKKAKPTTVTNIRDGAVVYLEQARADNIIVDSKDPATGVTIRAWHNLKVYTSGDISTLNVGLFPVPGINFQLNELFLQLPTQSA